MKNPNYELFEVINKKDVIIATSTDIMHLHHLRNTKYAMAEVRPQVVHVTPPKFVPKGEVESVKITVEIPKQPKKLEPVVVTMCKPKKVKPEPKQRGRKQLTELTATELARRSEYDHSTIMKIRKELKQFAIGRISGFIIYSEKALEYLLARKGSIGETEIGEQLNLSRYHVRLMRDRIKEFRTSTGYRPEVIKHIKQLYNF